MEPHKHAIMCQYKACTGRMLPVQAQYWQLMACLQGISVSIISMFVYSKIILCMPQMCCSAFIYKPYDYWIKYFKETLFESCIFMFLKLKKKNVDSRKE